MQQLFYSISTLVILGLLYTVPAAVLSLPFWIFGRFRARWVWWEFSIVFLPYVVFISLQLRHVKGGLGLATLWGLLLLSVIAPVAALVRVVVGERVNRTLMAPGVLIGSCLFAVAFYLLLPPMRI